MSEASQSGHAAVKTDRSWERVKLFMRLPSLAKLPEPPETPPGFIVRPVQADEVGALARLLTRAFEEPWDEARVRKELIDAQDVEATYVVAAGERLMATASARVMQKKYPESGYVHWVGADPEYQGRGLGTLINLRVLQHFRDAGMQDAVLETHDFRLPAIRSYLRLGFVPEAHDRDEQQRWSRVLPQLVR